MTPLDLLLWAGAILLASIPLGIAITIIGYCIVLIRKEMSK